MACTGVGTPAEERWEGKYRGERSDGADNDGNGDFDCNDQDCSGAPDCADTDTDTDTDTPCDITAAAESPFPGQGDVYHRMPITFELAAPDATASVVLRDRGGASVTGALSMEQDGELVVFTPSSPLEPLTPYTATLSWCGGEARVDFTTSELGQPLKADVAGRAYIVDLAMGRFREPAGVGDLLGGLIEAEVLFEVTAVSSTSISFRGGATEAGSLAQDTCLPTEEHPAADREGPFFSVELDGSTLSISGAPLIVSGISFSATFAPDGTYYGGGELRGELDARDLSLFFKEMLDDNSPESVCDLVRGFGLTCAACGSDGEAYCLPLHIDQLAGETWSDNLLTISEEDCHRSCSASCSNEACPEASDFPVCN